MVEKEEKVAELRHQLRERLAEEAESRPRQIGRHKLVREKPLVLLSDELPDSLRHLQAVGNPARDRFRSFQKRNMIETHAVKRYVLLDGSSLSCGL